VAITVGWSRQGRIELGDVQVCPPGPDGEADGQLSLADRVTDGVGDQFGDGQDHVINMVAIDLGDLSK
jgi:hypothetical protein